MQHEKNHFIIKITCPAVSGIVAAVTTYLADNSCYIGEMAQFLSLIHISEPTRPY